MNLETLNVVTGAMVAQKGCWREGCIPCLRVPNPSPEDMLLALTLEPGRGIFLADKVRKAVPGSEDSVNESRRWGRAFNSTPVT